MHSGIEWSKPVHLTMIMGLLALVGAGSTAAESVEDERADVERMAHNTLEALYTDEPGAKAAIERSAGYAVFRAAGVKIFLAGGGMGQGLAVDNPEGAKTYMKMAEVQAGLGMGVKKFRLVWVFEDQDDFDNFVNTGWELGGQSTAAAKVGDDGVAYAGAISIKPGVWLYQITDQGLALELTAKGTRYFKDKDLN